MFIDTHAHLQDLENPIKVVEAAKQNNVKKIICASYDLNSSERAVELSEIFEVYAIIGVHPENCEQYNDEVEQKLILLAENKKVVGIGEIGLDYHYSKENKELQKTVFEKQIILADKLKLPIVIHTRDAIGDTMEIIRKNKDKINCGGVFHCFNASEEILQEIAQLGFCVSYGGAITFNNASNLRELVNKTSLINILTETDCPYMAPVPVRGTINEPKNIDLIIQKIAEIKQMPILELEKIIEENTKKIFKI